MYLSHLLVDVGTDPDRPRPGRTWLRQPYRVHQRLCMAFPSDGRKQADPQFLKPFAHDGFERQVDTPRTAHEGFLYRVDPFPLATALPGQEPDRPSSMGHGRAVILVQSAIEPDWDYAFHNACHLLAARPETRVLDMTFSPDEVCCFRLRANPTAKMRVRADRSPARNGVRVGLYTEDEQLAWLQRKAQAGGFSVVSCHIVPEGKVLSRKGGEAPEDRMQHLAVRFDGVLRVTDPDCLLNTLRNGIGSAKAFGFGLLSLARA